MKLTTKRNRRYFRRELFSYMIPMILIVGIVDVFYHFMQCPLHPEWSAPCNVNRILAAIYGIFLILTIILEIISAKTLRNIKKQIEEEFFSSINSYETNNNEKIKEHKKENDKPNDNEDEGIIDMIEKSKHEEDDNFEKGIESKAKKTGKLLKRKIKSKK